MGFDLQSARRGDLPGWMLPILADRAALSQAEETELVRRWQQDGDLSARDELVTRCAKLFSLLCGRYRAFKATHAEDLLQTAFEAALEHGDRFDTERGKHFASYALYSARRAMFDHVMEFTGAVRYPNGSLPLRDGQRTHIPTPVRLDAPISTDSEITVGEALEQMHTDEADSPEAVFVATETEGRRRVVVQQAMGVLRERERRLVELVYRGQTYREIARQEGVSYECIRQIVVKAFGKMRAALNDIGVTDDTVCDLFS